jgi:hypothetical protein
VRERERGGGALAGRMGRKQGAGPPEGMVSWAVRGDINGFVFLFSFFLFFFKSISNQFFKPF